MGFIFPELDVPKHFCLQNIISLQNCSTYPKCYCLVHLPPSIRCRQTRKNTFLPAGKYSPRINIRRAFCCPRQTLPERTSCLCIKISKVEWMPIRQVEIKKKKIAFLIWPCWKAWHSWTSILKATLLYLNICYTMKEGSRCSI